MTRFRLFLLGLVVAAATLAPKCSSEDCAKLQAEASRICAQGPSQSCDLATIAAQQCTVAPTTTTSTTTTTTVVPEPTPEPVCTVGQTCGCWHRPPNEPWTKFPDCPPPPPSTTLPPPPPPTTLPSNVQRADGARVEVARHGVDGYMVTLIPTRGGQDVRPKDRVASIGTVAWRWSSCHAPGESPRSWTNIAPSQDPLKALVWISAGDCIPKGKTRTRVRVASCLTGVSLEVILPTVETLPGPSVAPCAPPPPPPPPPSGIAWRDTSPTDNCPEGGSDPHGGMMSEILVKLFGPQGGTYTGTETELCTIIAQEVRARGCDLHMYGEECAVACSGQRSSNYDFLATNKTIRRPPGAYRSSCFPATRSEVVTVPPAGPAPRYPAPVVQVRAKVHVPASQRPDGRAVLDAVALGEGDNPDFPGRRNWPACGPEGSAGREECDRGLGATWEGGDPHPSNPWLRFARPGQRARVCVGAVCSEWVTP